MPRHPRVHAAGLLYHVMARGNNGQKIFLSQSDFQAFIEALRTVRQRYPFSLYAYVLMSNHFHLLLEVDRFPTARILQSLLTGYARRFNRKHRRRGHLFEGRYKAIVCDRDSYLLELVRYIHLNPVRAAMVKRPGGWRWSGHEEYLGKENRGLIDFGPVMGELGTAARYEAFMREGANVNYRAEWHPGEGVPFLGPDRFVKKIAKETVPPPISRRASLKDLLKSVAVKAGLRAEILLRKGRLANVVETRDRFIREAVFEQGYLASQVADFLGCHPSNVSRALQKS
jgi:REP element-mobilizing transposase RayT